MPHSSQARLFSFQPKLFSLLSSYHWTLFKSDLRAGIIVGIVALPLAIAFSIASGVTPNRGLIASIVGGFLISLLGGSRVQIGGATGAFVVIVYRVVGDYGIQGLMICTFISGVFLILMGMLRWGTVIKFIPYPLTVGFTAGIAVLIASSQIKDLLGLQIPSPLPSDFTGKWVTYFKASNSIHPLTVFLSLSSLALLFLWPRISRRIPGSLMVILIMTLLVQIFHLPVATIGSGVDSLLPSPVWLRLSFQDIKTLVSPAFTLALLGAIQSLLSATVADSLIEGRHRSNTELITQGVANLVVPLFGGLPVTGAIARTLTNAKNGARTPIAGIIHAFFLLTIILLFGKWISSIPLFSLSSILLAISYNMAEWHTVRTLLRAPRMDVAVMTLTFILTVFVDLSVGVEVGLLMAFALFVKRMTDVTTVKEITMKISEDAREEENAFQDEEEESKGFQIPPGVAIYEAEGAFFFGVAEKLRDTLHWGRSPPKVMILRMRHVLAIDATGLRALQDLKKGCDKSHTTLILEGLHTQPLHALERAHLLDVFGENNLAKTLSQALSLARQNL